MPQSLGRAPYVVVTGAAASGKSTLGTALARALNLPVLDKDDLLEALYDTLGVGDLDWRNRLSRASDEILFRAAKRLPGAVLISFWQHDISPPPLHGLGGSLIQVYCHCDLEIAKARFLERTRHAGHLDSIRGYSAPASNARRPLALRGPLIEVDTSGDVDIAVVVTQVKAATRRLRNA